MIDASFIIPVKGRLEHLQQTLPEKLNQRGGWNYEIIIVDCNCPNGTANWCRSLENEMLRVVEIPAPNDYFNLSHSRNVGGHYACSEVLCFSDADCFLSVHWLDYVLKEINSKDECIGLGNEFVKGIGQLGTGTWAVRKEVWKSLRGYDETMEGWGGEDLDFLWRMKRFGQVASFPRKMAWTINHGNENRTEFYREKDMQKSNMRNLEKANRKRILNPVFGQLDRNVSMLTGSKKRKEVNLQFF
ncbi:MAG: glycosyltransferase family 2 protein [Candidatus Scalindua sp.]|nr:glycosyltransferase family 2 protein [Candidatus Scalindua sp.]MCR4343882.1 glycosyltransferase family 2 protein [Candidatus Scalindua sp.]